MNSQPSLKININKLNEVTSCNQSKGNPPRGELLSFRGSVFGNLTTRLVSKDKAHEAKMSETEGVLSQRNHDDEDIINNQFQIFSSQNEELDGQTDKTLL